MHTNMNFPAPFSVLGFAASFGGLAVCLLAMLVAAAIRKTKFVRILLRLVAGAAAAYGLMLVGFSLASHQVVLGRGQEKYFCEIDCHLAYSVVETKAIPVGDSTQLLITIKTRFDEATISPQRPKDLPLTPNVRDLYLVDSQNTRYDLDESSGRSLSTPLRPGESYTTTLSFQVPKQARGL